MQPLDFSVRGLFPDHAESPMTISATNVMREMCLKVDMTGVTQERIREDAKRRYDFVSREERISLEEADHLAFVLHRKGVSVETAKTYASLRLSPEDAAVWTIKIV
jgi:hypothetical protein